jgi:hypothetical protein
MELKLTRSQSHKQSGCIDTRFLRLTWKERNICVGQEHVRQRSCCSIYRTFNQKRR